MRIESGKEQFYQWDINQRLIVDNEIVKEVHFSNALSESALVVEVFEENGQRLVNVPNILLTQRWNIKAYGYCGECVRQEANYNVVGRDKPADYIYTETEVKRYEDLEKRVDAMEDNLGDIVREYLEENPPEINIEGYATIDYVDKAIKDIDFPETDLSNYYTKSETNSEINKAKPDLTPYALKTDIPSLNGYATTDYVDNAIPAHNKEIWVFTLEDGSVINKEVLLN